MTVTMLSPLEQLYTSPVQSVTVPSSEGDIMILGGHTKYLGALEMGTIRFQGGQGAEPWFIVDGFVDVTPDSCVITSDTLEPLKSFDRGTLERLQEKHIDRIRFLEDAILQDDRNAKQDMTLRQQREDEIAKLEREMVILHGKIDAIQRYR